VAIEKPDQTLENILKGIRRFAAIDLRERPRVSLEWKDNMVIVRASDPDALFNRVFSDRPTPVRALSLAPYAAVREFHGKVFQYQGSRYRVQGSRSKDFPYFRRFLELEYLEAGVQLDTDEAQTRVERVEPDELGGHALLWIDPQLIELDEGEASYLFDYTPTKPRLGSGMTGAFFLPPVRTAAHEDLQHVLRAEEAQDPNVGSYFSPELVGLRKALLEHASAGRVSRDEPTAVTIARLVDDPLLRDVFLDGGSIRVLGAEGQPTALALNVSVGRQPGAMYRASALLNPEGVEGPEWGRALMAVIREDIRNLVEGGLQIRASDPQSGEAAGPVTWRLQPLRPYRPGGHDGTWRQIQSLAITLNLSPALQQVFEHRVLLPTRERAGENSPPDNDLSELLFLHDLWRCAWSDSFEETAWRHAMLELLRQGFPAADMSPQQRVESWNAAAGRASEADRFSFSYARSAPDHTLLVRYSGTPDDGCVLKWRLLLPLGTVINARTFFLDRAERSRLDSGFVLA
jgi:hypothetical protein